MKEETKQMGLMKKLTSAIVASSLVISLVATASAAYAPATAEVAAKRMETLKLLNGRPDCGLCLNSEITRAELVTVIVRAFGKEEDAKLLKGSTIFPDIQNHWASGNIAMAVALVEKAGSDPIGMPNGKFEPDTKLTPAQAVAFLMKFLGQKADGGKTWPNNYLDVAVDKGLITAEDKALIAPMLNENATRGLVFYLFDRAFYNYALPDGKTFYTKYVDPTKPELMVTEPAATTIDSKVTIKGKATGAAEVFVGTSKVTLAADGSFEFAYDLPELKEYPIVVTAKDVAGNSVESKVTVTRTTGDAATIEAKLEAALLKAGAETKLTVVVKDKAGNEIKDAAYDVEVTGDIGTYADGVFTAAAMPATGTIKVTSGDATPVVLDVAVVAGDLAKIEVSGAVSAKIGQAVTFSAKGFDASGNEVDVQNVTWVSSKGGVINPTTGEFAGTASGNVTVSAKVGDVAGETTIAVYGDAAALAVTVPTGLVANGTDTKTVEVKVVDASGAAVTNSAADVTLSLSGGNIRLKDANGTAQTQMTAKAVNGVATFTVFSPTVLTTPATFAASSTTVSATSGTLTGALGTVSAVAPTVGSVQLTTTPSATSFEASGSVTVSAKIVDTAGVQIPAPAAFSVTLSNSNTTSAGLSGTSLAFNAQGTAPTANVTLTLNAVPGDIAISGTTTAGYAIQGLNLSTKISGPAYKLALVSAPVDNNADKGEFTVKVAVQDSLGTTKTTNSSAVVNVQAKHEDGTTIVNAQATASSGVAEVKFNPTNTNPLRKVGTWTFTISDNAGTLIAPTEKPTAKVTPGAVTQVANLKVNGSAAYTMVANGAQTAAVTVEFQDAYNNLVDTATDAVTFKTTGTPVATKGLDTTGVTVNAVNGKASVTVTSGIAEAGPDTIVVVAKKADNTLYTGSTGALGAISATVSAQIVGAPAALQAVTPAAQTAGTDFTVSFNIMDASPTPRAVTTDAGRAVSLEILDGTTVVGTQTTTTVDGVAKFTVNMTTAKNYTFKAKALFNGVEKSATTGAVTINPAAPASIIVKADLASVETGTVLTNGVYPVAKDAFGNDVAGATFTNFAYTINGSTTLSGRLTNNATPPVEVTSGTATYRALNAAETVTIGDSDNKATATVGGTAYADLPVTTATVTTYIAGPAYQLKLAENPANFTAGSNATIKVGLYDGAGNLKTGDNGTTVTLAVPTGVTNPDTSVAGLSANTVNGIATFTVTGASAIGSYQFEASSGTYVKATGIAVTATTGTATQVAVAGATLTADGSSIAVLTFKVADANGNVDTSASGTMTFTTSGTGATLLSTSAPISNGQAVVQVKATTQSGSFVVTPAISGSTLTMNAATVTVNPGAPSSTTSSNTVNAGTAYFVLRDAYGNAISSGYDVEFEDGTALTFIGNGMYSGAVAGHTSINVYVAGGTTALFTVTLP